jgi:hypothetical protein
MKKLLSLIVVMFAVVVSAQTLPCENLLANYPMPKVEFSSVVQAITSSLTIDGQEVQTVTTQTIDYANRRLLQETNAMGLQTVMRYADGKASMGIVMGEETMSVPIPDESASSLEGIFDQPVLQNVPQNLSVVSCDGQQSYAGLLSGEQVTVTTVIPTMGNMTSKIIFTPEGETQGVVSSVPGRSGEMLMVFEELTLDASNVPTHMKMTMYQLEGDAATLFTSTVMDILSYNQPLDDALFAE